MQTHARFHRMEFCRRNLTWTSYFRHFWILTAIHWTAWESIEKKGILFVCMSWRWHSHFTTSGVCVRIMCDHMQKFFFVSEIKSKIKITPIWIRVWSSNWKFFELSQTVTAVGIFFSFRLLTQYSIVITIWAQTVTRYMVTIIDLCQVKCICTAAENSGAA